MCSCFAGEKKKCCFCQKAIFNLLFLFIRIWKSLCQNPSPLISVSTVHFRSVLMEAQTLFSPSHCLCVHFNIQPIIISQPSLGNLQLFRKHKSCLTFMLTLHVIMDLASEGLGHSARVSCWHCLKRQHVLWHILMSFQFMQVVYLSYMGVYLLELFLFCMYLATIWGKIILWGYLRMSSMEFLF